MLLTKDRNGDFIPALVSPSSGQFRNTILLDTSTENNVCGLRHRT